MKAKRKKEWFDDDAFWQELYPFMFSDERLAEAEVQADNVLALVKPTGKSVLDLCCGPGRFAIALAKRGFSVVGVDRTRFLLDKARAKARAAKAKVEWVQQDMRDFVRPATFDLVLSMFTSFGYFDRKEEDMHVLENLVTSLRPGDVCLFDMLGKERLASIFQPTSSDKMPDGATLVQRREIFDDWTRIRNEWILLRGNKAKRFMFHHTVYSGQELRDRLEAAGLVDVVLYGSFEGEPYDPQAQRLIAVGRKPRN